MKKIYETAEIEVFLFKAKDVIVASAENPEGPFVPKYTKENDETEIL